MLIDSNIFLENQLSQKKAKQCDKFLKEVKKGKINAYITSFHIDAISIIMESYGSSWREIMTFLSSLYMYEGLSIINQSTGQKTRSCLLMKEHGLDFDDSIALQSMIDSDIEKIVSFDTDFDNIENIERIEPEKALN